MGIKLTQEEKDLIKKYKQYIIDGDWDGFSNSLSFSLSSDDDEFAHIFQFCLECVPDLFYKITYIPDSAFSNSDIKSITIPSNIKRIESGAFCHCESLKNITIPDSVIEIEDYAFAFCDRLKSIIIPNSVTEIGDCAFDGCRSLTNITIPDSVTKIGSFAFSDCYNLTHINIPDSVTEIGWSSFECKNLKHISIPKHLKGKDFLQNLPKDCEIEVRS